MSIVQSQNNTDIKQLVQAFVSVENKISSIKEQEKQYKEIKDKIKTKIFDWSNGRRLVFQLPNGYVKVNHDQRKGTLSKSLIEEAAERIHLDTNTIDKLLNAIEEIQQENSKIVDKIQYIALQ